MDTTFIDALYREHRETKKMPSPDTVCNLINLSLELLFPELSNAEYFSITAFKDKLERLRMDYKHMFHSMQLEHRSIELTDTIFQQIPHLKAALEKDAEAICKEDPAAKDIHEVKRSYPGFYAIAIYRFAHVLHQLSVPYIPRILTEYAHSKTGIDIHPNAIIGENFCIDHGSGVVIGETVVIGNNVKLYQNVTLGALSVDKTYASVKRHPTIEDDVIIYSGATILGGDTIIGKGSVIGGNAWLTKSIAPFSKIYYQPNIKNSLDPKQKKSSPLITE